jgi:hypothetical protein
MIGVAVEARARQLLWHFKEYRVFGQVDLLPDCLYSSGVNSMPSPRITAYKPTL